MDKEGARYGTGGGEKEENERRRSGELRGACKRSSTPGHRRHTATIQPYQAAAETTPSGASPVFILLHLPSSTSPAIATSTRCSFQSSFLHLFAGAPRPITSGAPHPKRYALFSFPASLFPLLLLLLLPCPPSPTLPSHIPSFISSLGVLLLAARSRWLDLLSSFFRLSAISYSALWE